MESLEVGFSGGGGCGQLEKSAMVKVNRKSQSRSMDISWE